MKRFLKIFLPYKGPSIPSVPVQFGKISKNVDFSLWGKQSILEHCEVLDCFYLSTQVYQDKQFVLQDGRPYGSFFLTERSICCFIFGARPAALQKYGRRRWPNFNTEVFFFVKTSKAGREMMTDTSGLSVFSKYIGILIATNRAPRCAVVRAAPAQVRAAPAHVP